MGSQRVVKPSGTLKNVRAGRASPHLQTKREQANYINALAVSVSPFFEPAMPMTVGGLFVTLGGFGYDIG
jgi:hypothetical protein